MSKISLENALGIIQEQWNKNKREFRSQGLTFEEYTLMICSLNDFEFTHDDFVEWRANGRLPNG